MLTLSDENVEKLLRHPPLIWRLVEPDNPDFYLEATGANKKPGLVGKLLGKVGVKNATKIPEFELMDAEGAEEDLDKSWHGIHYLMTGRAWEGVFPLDFLICGGEEVGDIDMGSGPARAFRTAEVREIAMALAGIEAEALVDRFDAEEMMSQRIYPEIWLSGAGGKDALDYCLEYFEVMKGLVQHAAHENVGIVVHLR